MSQRLVEYVLGAMTAVLRDCAMQCPTTINGVERDLSRLSVIAQTRGLAAFTVHLPAQGAHFLQSLEKGTFTKPTGPFSRTINRGTVIPRLFQGFLLRVFERDGMLKKQPCVQSIAALHQIYNLAKKLEIPCPEAATFSTIADFYAVEESLPPASQDAWDSDVPEFEESVTFDTFEPDVGSLYPPVSGDTLDCAELRVCQTTFDILSSLIGVFDPYEARFRHGPGAVSDLRVGIDYKYRFPTWSDRLGSVFPVSDFAYANWDAWIDAHRDGTSPAPVEGVSRLICVPKTQKGPRLIAAEPTSNQFCQQAIRDFLASRVRATMIGRSVHFDDQTYNQEAALRASQSGDHWTVDLSAASDRVSLRFVERAFRRNQSLLAALAATRTRFLSQNIDKKMPLVVKLKKFSTMGSAVTFPVQSIIFYGLAVSAMLIRMRWSPTIDNIRLMGREVLVFGDDMIIPKDSGQVLEKLLTFFKFKVNSDKTFRTGKFRESCGTDAYDGVNVTPSYLRKFPEKRKPASIISAVDTHNNLLLRGMFMCADYVKSRVPVQGIATVAVESGAFGFKTLGEVFIDGAKLRYDRFLQKYYIRSLVLHAKETWTKPTCNGQLLQFFTEAAKLSQFAKWQSGYAGRPALRLRAGRVYIQNIGSIAVI